MMWTTNASSSEVSASFAFAGLESGAAGCSLRTMDKKRVNGDPQDPRVGVETFGLGKRIEDSLMTRITTAALIAGAALGMNASAQTNLDTDRAYAAELLADAGARASLLQSGTAGHDGNFFMASGDGNYRLNISGATQFRYVASFIDDNNQGPDDEDFASGFDLTRAFIDFTGNVINPETTFKIRGEFAENYGGDSDFGDFELQDAWGQHEFENGVSVRWGQFKAPVTYEEFYIDDTYQLAVDRSVTNEFFNADYTQGIALSYRDENWGGTISVNDGGNTDNTPFFSASEADIGLTARVDFLLAGGDWGTFSDFTSFRGNDTMDARIGGAIHWQTAGDTAAFGMPGTTAQVAVADVDYLLYTVDVSLEGDGWNVFGAFIGSNTDFNGSGSSSTSDFDDFGAVIQGGFFVADQWELFARWDAIFFDSNRTPSGSNNDDDFHTGTVGFNYYFVPESHAAKFSADLQWFFNEQNSTTGIGSISPSQTSALVPSNQDDEIAIRLQMQLMF